MQIKVIFSSLNVYMHCFMCPHFFKWLKHNEYNINKTNEISLTNEHLELKNTNESRVEYALKTLRSFI